MATRTQVRGGFGFLGSHLYDRLINEGHKENESTDIPLGHRHRLLNPGKGILEIIEVQSGQYLGEDDIERFNDSYELSKKYMNDLDQKIEVETLLGNASKAEKELRWIPEIDIDQLCKEMILCDLN